MGLSLNASGRSKRPDALNKFSMRKRGQSFLHAFNGIKGFFLSEHNAILHLFATIITILMGFILDVSTGEAIALTIAIGFVWICELFNTAIEKMMDHLSPEKSLSVKFIKDVSAAAVLLASVTSFIIGCIVFIPKLLLL